VSVFSLPTGSEMRKQWRHVCSKYFYSPEVWNHTFSEDVSILFKTLEPDALIDNIFPVYQQCPCSDPLSEFAVDILK